MRITSVCGVAGGVAGVVCGAAETSWFKHEDKVILLTVFVILEPTLIA